MTTLGERNPVLIVVWSSHWVVQSIHSISVLFPAPVDVSHELSVCFPGCGEFFVAFLE